MQTTIFNKAGLGSTVLLILLGGFVALASRPQGGAEGGVRPASALDLQDLDLTCKPCDDFFQYATGRWRQRNPVGPAYASWARFSELAERNQEALREILEAEAETGRQEARRGPSGEKETIDRKLGDFYAACMDEKAIERAGMEPLRPELARIAALSAKSELPEEVARMHLLGARVLFVFGAGQDERDSDQVIAQAMQGGLGLPDREYYTRQDQASQRLRLQYQRHIANMLRLSGQSGREAEAAARAVLALETKMAEGSKTRAERRDAEGNYHKMSAAELGDLMPAFSWAEYFKALGYPEIRVVNVGQPEYFRGLNRQLDAAPLEDWKSYLRWHLVHASAAALSSRFVRENFDFYSRRLTGTTEDVPRWRRCVSATDRYLGEALGQKYVARQFSAEAKARAETMVREIVAAMREEIETVAWMSEPTRREALAKLGNISLKIGYPERWLDYSAYQVARGPYIENLWRGYAFELRRTLGKIGKPPDRSEWSMTPPAVNAYYNASLNEIVFPAGILQPPFFDTRADDALNYGGIGAVIGHELTHGFDDQGSRYDAKGNLRDWWTPQDRRAFEQRAECVEKQFSAFVVDGEVHENGKLVLGEAIADLGGLNLARAALQRAASDSRAGAGGRRPVLIDGFTPMQRFFLAYARIWGANARPEYERMMAVTDAHPLPRFRVFGALSNMPEFAAAFSCPEGSAMTRPAEARCKVW